jgi:NADPH-dependent F420 reductase
MNVTILGAGNMARGIATRLLAGGNSVTLVARKPGEAAELATRLADAATKGAAVRTAAWGSAIADQVVVLAVQYGAAAPIVQQYGSQLAGKIIVDITNPLNASYDGLATPPGTSGAEEIAKVTPAGATVVKAFNTTFASTLAAGQVAGQPLDVFIAGDDAQAKSVVAGLISAGGLRPVDAGPLKRAQVLEAMALLLITLQGPMGTGFRSAIKILA